MPLKDILLHVDTYPQPTPPEAIDQAAGFAAALNSRLTMLAARVAINGPSNWAANRLIGLSGLYAEEEAKSRAACETAARIFADRLAARGVEGGQLSVDADFLTLGEEVARRARTYDLCLVPIMESRDGQRSIAEAVIFDSGRPVLVFHPGVADLPTDRLRTVVLAWDGSRNAARAMSDALPLLAAADKVEVLTVTDDKPEAQAGIGGEAARHLKAHGIDARVEEVALDDRKIGPVLADRASELNADLIVMGAYGRSRLREFVLGGATKHMLKDFKTPLLLSH